ncbi:MAG: hypothetical protein MJ227_02520 [Bacilli bacterium]|nr:hypothetical protein [Bacilli bacterium]
MKNITNKHIRILLSVLFFGGIWGFLEATLGSLLHLSFVADTVRLFASSTVIMVPIAMFLMACCYKKENAIRTVIYIGLLAAGIKAVVCAIFHLQFNACYYILLESGFCTLGLLVFNPKKVLSLRSLGAFALANTLYLFVSTTFIKYDVTSIGSEQWINYVLISNVIAISYVALFGFVLFMVKKPLEKKGSFNLSKIIYNPIVCSLIMIAAISMTIVLK